MRTVAPLMLLAFPLTSGCVLDRSGTHPDRDGDGSVPTRLDAGATDGGGRPDAAMDRDAGTDGDAGAPADAGAPPDAGASLDAGHDAGVDAGHDAGAGAPSCAAIYGGVSGHRPCLETETTCHFYFAPSGQGTCNGACGGARCLGSYDNGATFCPPPPPTLGACTVPRSDQVCVCARRE